eukprot:UN00611
MGFWTSPLSVSLLLNHKALRIYNEIWNYRKGGLPELICKYIGVSKGLNLFLHGCQFYLFRLIIREVIWCIWFASKLGGCARVIHNLLLMCQMKKVDIK